MCKKRSKQIEEIVAQAVSIDDAEAGMPPPPYVYEVWKDGPNIAVHLVNFRISPDFSEAFGFAKVNWPDQYDYGFGLNVALGKAAATLIKEEQNDSLS